MKKTEALKKLNNLLDEHSKLPTFIYKGDNSQFDKWKRKAVRYIEEIFENENGQSTEFSDIEFTYHHVIISNTTNFEQDERMAHNKGRREAKTLLESFIEEVEEWNDDAIENTIPIQIFQTTTSNKVFIVHGHDELAISQVSEVLRKLNLEPIILREQVSRSDTVIEKIETYTNDVGFGIILYTECDIGGKSKETLQSRARQNVVLEHGYLMAKLGRKNTVALVKGKVETPGDISGLVYTPMDEHKAWQYKLADELKASGYNVSKDNI